MWEISLVGLHLWVLWDPLTVRFWYNLKNNNLAVVPFVFGVNHYPFSFQDNKDILNWAPSKPSLHYTWRRTDSIIKMYEATFDLTFFHMKSICFKSLFGLLCNYLLQWLIFQCCMVKAAAQQLTFFSALYYRPWLILSCLRFPVRIYCRICVCIVSCVFAVEFYVLCF